MSEEDIPSYKKVIYVYKGKRYKILHQSKIKRGDKWILVIIYECQYENPDGQIWVREEKEFFEKFKPSMI